MSALGVLTTIAFKHWDTTYALNGIICHPSPTNTRPSFASKANVANLSLPCDQVDIW